jgi:hypothetical protein
LPLSCSKVVEQSLTNKQESGLYEPVLCVCESTREERKRCGTMGVERLLRGPPLCLLFEPLWVESTFSSPGLDDLLLMFIVCLEACTTSSTSMSISHRDFNIILQDTISLLSTHTRLLTPHIPYSIISAIIITQYLPTHVYTCLHEYPISSYILSIHLLIIIISSSLIPNLYHYQHQANYCIIAFYGLITRPLKKTSTTPY